MKKEMSYIVTPGLYDTVRALEVFFKAGDKPLMICGPTGTGKSLFIRIAEMLYREERGENANVQSVNCAMFGGDHNMVRSELFGHTEGSFTGAVANKEGWIRKADRGLLILDEIGEFSDTTQSSLLTFIEDGKFFKVGSAKLEAAQTRIVAATNNTPNLREDFKHRFFRLKVPAIHERRLDVLYYIAAKYPALISSLAFREILDLLAYQWTGNVREIESVCEMRGVLPGLDGIGKFTEFGPDREKVCSELENQGADLRPFERVICKLQQEMSGHTDDLFKKDERFDILICKQNDALRKAEESLMPFFELSGRDTGTKSPEYPDVPQNNGSDRSDIFSLNYDKVTEIYFKGLLIRHDFNQSRAAATAGMAYSTFRSKFKKLGLTQWLDIIKSEGIPAAEYGIFGF